MPPYPKVVLGGRIAPLLMQGWIWLLGQEPQPPLEGSPALAGELGLLSREGLEVEGLAAGWRQGFPGDSRRCRTQQSSPA